MTGSLRYVLAKGGPVFHMGSARLCGPICRMSKNAAWLTLLATAAFLGCFLFWPMGRILSEAFVDADGRFTFDFIAAVFRNPVYRDGLRNAFLIATASTILSIAIALPLAWVNDRFAYPGRGLLGTLLLVPMILPPFVGAIGLRQILGQYGALNALLAQTGLLGPEETIDWMGAGRVWGVIAVNALHLYPILLLNIAAALANIDPAMEEAAENLGCTGWRKFRRVTLPLVLPGLFAGGSLVFIFAFTELGTPLIFDYSRVTPVQIFYGIKEIAGNPFPYALVSVLLVSALLIYGAGRLAFLRGSVAMGQRVSHGRQERTLGPGRRWLCTLGVAGVVAVALLPHAGVVFTSLAGDWYRTVLPEPWTGAHFQTALGHGLTVSSILNSLRYASLSMGIDLVLGLAIAYVIVRTKAPGRWALDVAVMLPLAVPGLVLAFGYISLSSEGQPLALLNPAVDPTILLVIAYAVRRLPYVVRSAAAGLEQTSVAFEEAAQNLGATPLRVWRRVTIPLLSANLVAAGVLAFSFAMLEVSDSLLLAQRQQHYPITKAIYELHLLLGEGRYVAAALGVWAMIFLGLALLAAHRLLGRHLGVIFRA